jgi:aspartate/methionine/tyrosine aminotransferase
MARHIQGLSLESTFLYPPQGGHLALREAWRTRVAPRSSGPVGLPIVTAGITHGLSAVADLFAGPHADVVLPNPMWGNYPHLFWTRRGAHPVEVALSTPTGLDIQALQDCLSARTRPTLLVLNFPSNPGGWMPTADEADGIRAAIEAAPVPVVVLCDDAYQDMVWEPDALRGSLFHRLSDLSPDKALVVKVDGATKELFFFGGRVAFVTFAAEGQLGDALTEKVKAILRATTSATVALSQTLVLEALRSPTLDAEVASLMTMLEARYRRLKNGLMEAGLETWPYNSAFFALVGVGRDPEQVRQELLAESVGVIAIPTAGAVRVSYASVAEDDIDALVAALRRHR